MADPNDPHHPHDRLVLVTDFDGTLYRGDAPIRFYARGVAEGLSTADRDRLSRTVGRYLDRGVAAAEDAADATEAAALRDAVDAWEAVAQVASRCLGVPQPTLDAAFLATREHMTTDACALEVPRAYRELLTELRAAGVRVVLATNSPAGGLDLLLDRLEVRPLLDEVVSGTGKPAGLTRLLRAELGADRDGDGPPPASRCFAVGDHWRNDVEPALSLGVPGGYVDRYRRHDGPATAVAPDIEGLLPALRDWAAAPARLGA